VQLFVVKTTAFEISVSQFSMIMKLRVIVVASTGEIQPPLCFVADTPVVREKAIIA
jgi:hypothetical protein